MSADVTLICMAAGCTWCSTASGARRAARARAAGAGLGLALVVGIVAAHRGRVAAGNAPGGGACFTVLLSAAAPEPAAVVAESAQPPSARRAASMPPPSAMDQLPDAFRIDEDHRDDGTVVVRLRGEFDLASADAVQQRLDALQAGGQPVLLDLDTLAFMDSSGLRVVLQAVEAARERGWAFTLTPGSPQVRDLFASAGITGRLPIAEAP